MPEKKPFELRVSLSGLIVYVRNQDKITHALLQARRHHDPQVGVCGKDWSTTEPISLARLRLEVEWYVEGEWQKADGDRAIPANGNHEPNGLPEENNRYDFRWMPDLTELSGGGRVPEKFAARPTKAEPVPSVVGCQVVLGGGKIRTTQFAWGEEADFSSSARWIPKLACKRSSNSDPVKDQAFGEIACWVVETPKNATKVRIMAIDLNGEGEDSELVEATVKPGGFLGLEITNSPPQVWSGPHTPTPGRGPGSEVKHFVHLKRLLSGGSKPLPTPWVPPEFQEHSPNNPGNSIKEGLIPPGDCLGCAPRISAKAWGPLGSYQRPICIPGVADTE